jgi:hypothetical protein
VPAADESHCGPERGRLPREHCQRAYVRLADSGDPNDFFVDQFLATELQLRQREPDGRVEPEETPDRFLDQHPQPVAAGHVQKLMTDHGALRVERQIRDTLRQPNATGWAIVACHRIETPGATPFLSTSTSSGSAATSLRRLSRTSARMPTPSHAARAAAPAITSQVTAAAADSAGPESISPASTTTEAALTSTRGSATNTIRSAGRASSGSAKQAARISRQYVIRARAMGSRTSAAPSAPVATTITTCAL